MLKERVQQLCKETGITVKKLEETLGLGNGAIGKWDKYKPKADNLEKVADYFDVTTDYLLGRTNLRDKILPVHAEIEFDSSEIDKAFALLQQMDSGQQKTAIRLLKALAEENK